LNIPAKVIKIQLQNLSFLKSQYCTHLNLKNKTFQDLFDEDDVAAEVAADVADDSAEAKRRLRRFKRKRITENKSILETMDQSVDESPIWSDTQKFTCFVCSSDVTGVASAMRHMSDVHRHLVDKRDDLVDDDEQPELVLQCILCPKTTNQLDLLKIHLWRHCNSITPTTLKTSTPRTPTKSWAENQKWSCKKCLPIEVKKNSNIFQSSKFMLVN
jgi:hypothetical protein